MWKNNSSRLNNEIFSNNIISKFRDKIFDSNNMKSLLDESIKKSNRKKYNAKNIKYNISSKQNKFFLTQKIDFFIKKVKKLIYRKIFELIKSKYNSKNNLFKKGKNSFKTNNKIKERKTESFKKNIKTKIKENFNDIKKTKMKNNNPLFLYNNLGLNILGTQPSKESIIKKYESSVRKRKINRNNFIINSDKKYITKTKNNKIAVISKNSKDAKGKKINNFEKNVLAQKNINKRFDGKIEIKPNPKLDKSNVIQNEHKGRIKYYNTEIFSKIVNTNYSKDKIEQIEKMLLKRNFEKNKNIKVKKSSNDIIFGDDKNSENIQNLENDETITINNNKFIKNSFFYWKSSVIKQKIVDSLFYKAKFDKIMNKINNIIIGKIKKVINICVLFKYFQKYKDKYFRWKIIKNLKKTKTKKSKTISKKETNKFGIINNININNYIYSDYNKFIKQKYKSPVFVSKLIYPKNQKENLFKEIKDFDKEINIFGEKNQNINNYNNYIFLNQTDRSFNKINRNLFLENCSKEDLMFVKSININGNDKNLKSKFVSNNIINQINQLRMVINLIEKHRRQKMSLLENFHKWALITKLDIRKNSPELYKSFSNNKRNIYERYSMNRYNKKITNVAFSSKKSDKKEDSDNYTPVKEIKNFRSITTGKIPYYDYCKSSNMINSKANTNKVNININSFKLIETNNNINNNYIYHKKKVNISNISGINNCFLENNNIINKNISMNLTNTSYYCNKMFDLNKPKFIEEKKVSLKKLNRIEEREINFALYKIKNLKNTVETPKKNNPKSKNEILINSSIQLKKNDESDLFENCGLNRTKSFNLINRKNFIEFNDNTKICDSSFSFLRNKFIL